MGARLLWLVAAAAIVAVVVVGLRQAPETTSGREPAKRTVGAAELSAKLRGAPPALAALHRQANSFLAGERAALSARLRALRDHPVVVNVWAAWCGPCRSELPIFQRASVRWGTRVGFLGVDLRDNPGSAARLLREIPLTYPSYEDPRGRIAHGYGLVGTPSTIYYDSRGRQTHVHPGPYLELRALDDDIARYALAGRS